MTCARPRVPFAIEMKTSLITKHAEVQPKTPWWKPSRTHWEVMEDFVLSINGQNFCVPEGTIFDGSSIPWFLWWRFQPTYYPSWPASAVHDYVYEKLYHLYPKWWADWAFYSIMLHLDGNRAISWLFHKAVSLFGKGGWADAKLNRSTW